MKRGFTILEVLIASTILAVVVSIVYASFAAVAAGMEDARLSDQALQLRRFLAKSLKANLTGLSLCCLSST